jgi:hypothetical protein
MGNLASATIKRPTLAGPISLSANATHSFLLDHPSNTVARFCPPRCSNGRGGDIYINSQPVALETLDADGCVPGLVGGRAAGWRVERRC